jgi:hypothetical protein
MVLNRQIADKVGGRAEALHTATPRLNAKLLWAEASVGRAMAGRLKGEALSDTKRNAGPPAKRTARLRALLDRGLRPAAIALRLGVSRDAVLGKIYRLRRQDAGNGVSSQASAADRAARGLRRRGECRNPATAAGAICTASILIMHSGD